MHEKHRLGFIVSLIILLVGFSRPFQEDVIETSTGKLEITIIGHASLMFSFGGKVVHIDPVSAQADYATLPKADLILITHEHGDHFDSEAIAQIRTEGTEIVLTAICAPGVSGGIVMKNGESKTVAGLEVEAVPAYNVDPARPFHSKGDGNGYIITFGGKRVYVAGDTENTPEMMSLQGIDVAFLPMNMPFTMTPKAVADAAKTFRPRILYLYHTSPLDTPELLKLLEGEGIEIRVR